MSPHTRPGRRRPWVTVVKWVFPVVAIVLGYLFLWPTPIHPYAWTPPPNPGTGSGSRFAPTQDLWAAAPLASELIARLYVAAGKPNNFGPEDVTVGPHDGRIYTGLGDGSILRIDPSTRTATVFANTGGRPLGLEFTPDGRQLYVADGELGLVVVDEQGRLTRLSDEADGESLNFADNLDIAADGSVWFSAPTRAHTLADVALDVWDSRPSGRLLRYDPRTGRTEKVLDNLYYANGVELSADGSFVLVAEFLAFRIQRYWLRGPKAGSHEPFVDGLPGYPDNITRTPGGSFLVGLSLKRVPALDRLREKPWAVKAVYRLPSAMQPAPQFPGYLAELDADGRLLRFIADEQPGVVAQVTSATVLPAHPGAGAPSVVLGSLLVNSVRRLPLDQRTAGSARPVMGSQPGRRPAGR